MNNPYDQAEWIVKYAVRKLFQISLLGSVVELEETPAGVRWIGSPVGYIVAKMLRRNPNEIAREIAEFADRMCPCWAAFEVSSERGFVNVRWA